MEWMEILPPWVTFVVVTLAGILLLVLVALALRRRRRRTFPCTRQPAVLSREERALLTLLQQAVDDKMLVLPKVRAADVLAVRHNVRRRRRRAAARELAAEYFDFVLCMHTDSRPLVAVELEGGKGDSERDRFLDEVCASCAFGLLRVPGADAYTAEQLREQLRPHIQSSRTAVPTGDMTPDGRREPILDLPAD